jgi:hypothetical protein
MSEMEFGPLQDNTRTVGTYSLREFAEQAVDRPMQAEQSEIRPHQCAGFTKRSQ